MQIVWLLLIPVGLILVIGVYILRLFWHRLTALANSFNMTVLLVLVPRQGASNDHKTGNTEKNIADQLAAAEVLWAALGGLKAQTDPVHWLKGRDDYLSLELVVQDNAISFYVVVSQKMRSFVEQEIQATYPAAVIQEVSDYNIFLPKGVTVGGSLRLSRGSAFPIKTYKQLEADSLESILNAMAKIETPSAAALQLVVRSAARGWRRKGIHIASAMQQGKSLQEVSSENNLSKVFSFFSSFFGSTKKKDDAKHELHRLSPAEEQMIRGIEEKASKAGLDVTCRLVVAAPNEALAQAHLSNLANSFTQYSIYQYGNRFETARASNLNNFLYNFIHRSFAERKYFVLNTEELTTIYHFPTPQMDNPEIRWLTARQASPPGNTPATGILLGYSNYRGESREIHMLPADRSRHMYIVGKSGTGKSVFIENLAVQDIIAGEGVAVVDPHGDLVEAILAKIPPNRQDDVIIFDPSDIERPQGLNLLEYDPKYPEQKSFVINEMIKILDKLYDLRQTGGPMFEQYMRNAMLLIMDDPDSGATLMEISKVLADPDYRRYKLSRAKDQVVHDFWVKEAQKAGGDAALVNMVPYITSKLNQFISNDIMRPIIGQQKSAFSFRQVMDEKKILLVKLSKGKIGDMNAHLLGLVIVGKLLMASLSRTDIPEYQRQNFYLYIDEFQNFITDSIVVILSEARKYRLNLIVAHQYIGQLVSGNDTKIRDAVFGNIGTIAAFRVGVEDAELLAKEFAPVFSSYDLINIELFQAYLKLLINNTPSRPFNITTRGPLPGDSAVAAAVRQNSRLKYGRNRTDIEKEIIERAKKVLPQTSSQSVSTMPAAPASSTLSNSPVKPADLKKDS